MTPGKVRRSLLAVEDAPGNPWGILSYDAKRDFWTTDIGRDRPYREKLVPLCEGLTGLKGDAMTKDAYGHYVRCGGFKLPRAGSMRRGLLEKAA